MTPSLTTDVVAICKNNVLELASNLTMGVASIRQNGVTTKLASSLTMDIAAIRKNNVIE